MTIPDRRAEIIEEMNQTIEAGDIEYSQLYTGVETIVREVINIFKMSESETRRMKRIEELTKEAWKLTDGPQTQ
ncbi:MAG: hypothetical protein AAB546_04235 [Patescibacteria group bacterium]